VIRIDLRFPLVPLLDVRMAVLSSGIRDLARDVSSVGIQRRSSVFR